LLDGTISSRNVPVAVNNSTIGNRVVAIAAGEVHSMAITNDGKLYAWGVNSNGQLGVSTITHAHTS
jgi:alpha-tubulin suppressor-like RCC1 family protein